MGILIDKTTGVIAVAATGSYGSAQVNFMRQAGTRIVGFVSPGRGGTVQDGLPVFDLIEEAVAQTGAAAAAIYAPPFGVRAYVIECAEAGIRTAVAFAENVPLHDTMHIVAYARAKGMKLIGPNTLGVATPGQAIIGSIAPSFMKPGPIGVIGRSGTLTLSTTRLMTSRDIGQSTLIHVGGDSIAGLNPHEIMEEFLLDPSTEAIAYLGEIGGSKEYRLAETIAKSSKPVFVMIVGRHAPAQKRMGHAGAMIEEQRETAAAKREALAQAGATVCDSPIDLVEKLAGALRKAA